MQSVYPFYEDSDVVADGTLAGNWAGDGELKNWLLNISFDPATKDYLFSISDVNNTHSEGEGSDVDCESNKLGGKLIQLGTSRFFDLTLEEDKFWPTALDTVLKVETDKQRMRLTPLDPEWMASALRQKSLKLEGRVRESGELLPTVAVTITSPTNDLREFLQQQDARSAFSESGRMSLHRK